jgi:hypothetical protein
MELVHWLLSRPLVGCWGWCDVGMLLLMLLLLLLLMLLRRLEGLLLQRRGQLWLLMLLLLLLVLRLLLLLLLLRLLWLLLLQMQAGSCGAAVEGLDCLHSGCKERLHLAEVGSVAISENAQIVGFLSGGLEEAKDASAYIGRCRC